MANKTERKMSPKGFLHKSNTKAGNSAIAFLAAHRAWLSTGEVSDSTSPILRKVDDGLMMPTPALMEIRAAVMAHIITSDRLKLEEAMEEKANPSKGSGLSKNYVASVFDATGAIQTRIKEDGDEEELIKGFELPQRAEGWADRRLFDGASDWYATVIHTPSQRMEVVYRSDAMARILKQPKGPAIHKKAVSTKSLSFGVKAKGDHFSFSKG